MLSRTLRLSSNAGGATVAPVPWRGTTRPFEKMI
jgi:hypothetical protein